MSSRTFRTLLLAVLMGGATLLAIAGAAEAHPIHNGCETPQVWADAYLDQLIGPMAIAWVPMEPWPMVRPIVYVTTGDPQSGIVCIP